MPLRKVEVYEASDGATFKSKREAIKYEIECAAIEWADQHALDISDIHGFLNWMTHNPAHVTHLLKELL